MSRRKKRVATFAKAGAVSVVFAFSFAGAALGHVNLPVTRRLVARNVSALLATVFHGRLVVESIDHIGWNGADIAWVRVYDPEGHRIVTARGLHADVFLPRLVAAIFADGPLIIHIPYVRLREAEVLIDLEPNHGGIGMARAFLLRTAPPPPGLPDARPPSRGLRIELPSMLLEHGFVLGNEELGAPLNADVFQVPASLAAGSEGVTLDVERFHLIAREPAPLYPTGDSDYHLRVPDSDTGLPPLMWATLDGHLGAVAFHAQARMESTHLTGSIDLPHASPDELHTLVPGLPLREEKTTLHADIDGELPELHVDARAVSGPGEVTARGQILLGSPVQMGADVTVHDLDPRSLLADVPPASFGAEGHVDVAFRGSHPIVQVSATTLPTTLEQQRIPAVDARFAYDESGVHGVATVHEPGLPADVSFYTVPGESAFHFDTEIRSTDLYAAPRLHEVLRGEGVVTLRGRIDPLGVDVAVDGQFPEAGAAGFFRVANAHVTGRLWGPLRDVDVDATLEGEHATLGDALVERVHVQAAGALARPHVALMLDDERWKQLTLQGDVRTTSTLRIDNLRAAFHEAELDIDGRVDSVDLRGGNVALRGVRIDSNGGALEGDLVLHTQGIDADFAGTLDLRRLGKLVPAASLTGGTATFSAHLQRRGNGHEGKVSVRLEDVETAAAPVRAGVGLDAVFHGTNVHAAYGGHVASRQGSTFLSFQGDGDGALQGSLFSPATWQKATGHAALQDVSVDVSRAFENELVKAAIDHDPTLPVARGKIRASLSLDKDQPDVAPVTHLVVQTNDFALRIPTGTADDSKRVDVEGVDATLGLTVTPTGPGSKTSTVALGLRLSDERGDITSASAHTHADARQLWRDAMVLVTGSGGDSFVAAQRVTSLPLQAHLAWADRSFDDLPSILRPKDVAGRVRGAVDITGTLAAPEGNVAVQMKGVAFRNLGPTLWPVDGAFAGHVGKDRMETWGKLLHDGAEVAELSFGTDAGLARLLSPAPETTPWRAGGQLVLRGLQLEAIPFFAPYGIRGRVSGTVAAAGLHDQPDVAFDLTMLRAAALGGEFPTTTLRGRLAAAGGSFVSILLRQGASTRRPEGGTFEATALPAVSFPDGWLPVLDGRRTQTFGARLQNFSIESFSRLTEPILADLGGYLSGEATVIVPGAAPGASSAPPRVDGQLQWREGVFVVPQLGQTFTRSHFDVRATTQGDQATVALRNFEAAATTGRMQGSFDGMMPTAYVRSLLFPTANNAPPDAITGKGTLQIKESQKLPVTFEGTPVGDAFGTIETSVRADRQGVDIHVNVPYLTLDLPPDQNRSVQELAEAPDVGLVDRKNRSELKTHEPETPSLPVTVHLDLASGNASPRRGVFVRRTGIDVSLRGSTLLELTDQTTLRGSIQAVQGRVTVLGKPFVVERGLVRFEGTEPSNPYVEFTARWDSPDGTRVYVEAASLLKELKPFFRSNPPRSESAVLSLVLFGRDPTAAENASLPGQGNAAGSAALGGASTVLNSLLDPVQVFGRRLETRVDTSSARDARIGVATEIRPNLWAQIDVSTASRQIRQNADISAFTLDWRFRRNWSLRTSVGDRGSSNMDLLWQHRY